MADLPILFFKSQAAFRQWLDEHHAASDGILLKMAKKDSGVDSVTYDEALDEALCYGWIDSQKRGFDDTYWLQRFTPRRPRSKWSQRNRELVEELIAQGRMQLAGMQEVEKARRDGRWEAAYASASTIEVPPDLQAALDKDPQAQAFFDQLTGSNRYAILYRITTAKKPETRQRRIDKYAAMLHAGEKIYE